MPASPVRFRPEPPPRPESPALDWVLAAAFARAPAARGREPLAEAAREEAVERALALDLAARIATRLGRERLETAIGAVAAARLLECRARTAARGMALLEAASAVGELARERGIPLAWLKFAGLAAAGLDLVGRRGASDLDLLVPRRLAPRLVEALEAAGFRSSPLPQPEHQLATLVHPELGAVEVHGGVPGVRVGEDEGTGRRSAGYEQIEAAGLLADGARLAVGTKRLAPRLAAAHALVHAAWQSGWSAAYPHTRMLADLLDLGLDDPGRGLAAAGIAPLASAALADADVEALCSLAAALAAGRPPRRGVDGEPPRAVTERRSALWLDHFVALASSADYADAVRLRGALSGHEPGGPLLSRLRRLRRLLLLSAAEVEAIYGPQRGRAAILLRQLARPFDLIGRAWAGRAARRRLEDRARHG